MKLFFLCLILTAYSLLTPGRVLAVDPRPTQAQPDIFQCGTGCDMQKLNPVTVKAKQFRVVSYRLVTMTGCNTGSIPSDLQAVAADALAHWHLGIIRNDAQPDFVINIRCGNEQIRLCGSINIFCLPNGYPYIIDVSISDIINVYPAVTRRSILCHEICGHAIGTWNEQYCKGIETVGACKGKALFDSTPGQVDIMNTGPDSRHDLAAIEDERFDRTMYSILIACSTIGYDECTGRFFQPDGFSYEPSSGNWFNPQGAPEWSPCNSDRIRYNLQLNFFSPPASGIFVPSRGYWSFAPAC